VCSSDLGGALREDLWNVWFWTLLAIDPWHEGWPVEAGEPQAPAESLLSAEPDGLATAFDYPEDPEIRSAVVRRQEIPGLNRLRERWMAENIHRLMVAEPRARIVVWTGGQHAWKRSGSRMVRMASRWTRRSPGMAR